MRLAIAVMVACWLAMAGAAAEPHRIPIIIDGRNTQMPANVCRPDAAASVGLVVISHGRGVNPVERARQQPLACTSATVQWFLARGYVVISPLRPGYGANNGPDIEAQTCDANRDYTVPATIAARSIAAAIRYAADLPFVRHGRIVVIGQSAGGLASVAYGRHPDRDVVAIINMAGGNGGHRNGQANNVCFPDLLVRAAGRLGVGASIPELWVYAENDSFFAPNLARAMHAAFTRAGGKADLVQPGPFGDDGHRLFGDRNGVAIWGPIVGRYLATRTGG